MLLESVLLPDEVLIYDDRSTDGTYEYVQEYIDRYSLHTWKVYRNKENKGYSLNFSDAIDSAKGKLIFLCDQDDIWHSDKIEKMSKIMEENSPIELLASNVHPFYMGEHPQRVHYQKYKGELIKIRRLQKGIFINFVCIFYLYRLFSIFYRLLFCEVISRTVY